MARATSEVEVWDYVVVGAGSAGCVLANRLSEDRSCRVLLLEAGGSDRSPFIQVPAGMKVLLAKDKGIDWRFPAEADPSRNGVTDYWAAGKVLGGSSSINAMLWVRGHRADYDGWASAGCDGWDYESVLPYFKRAERYRPGGDRFRGDRGPQHVDRGRVSHVLTDAFVAAGIEAGHPENPDYNGERQEGVAYVQVSQRRGFRHSTARGHLAKARRRRNLTVRTGATVHRVVVQEGRARGVEYVHQGVVKRADASREVVLSAGAIASPKLLLQSGIGPAAHLADLGVPLVADVPGVGANLQEHATSMLAFSVNKRTLNQEMSPLRAIRHGLDFVLRGRGPAASTMAHAHVFDHLAGTSGPSDLQLIFSPFGLTGTDGATEGTGEGTDTWHDVHKMKLVEAAQVMVFVCGLHPQSRGTVRLRSSDPDVPPLVEHAMLGDAGDVKVLIEGCRRVRELFATKAFAPHVVREDIPSVAVQTDEEWEGYLRNASFHPYHQSGTCKMGIGADAVVDPRLRVRDVVGLRVVDASVMPTVTSGNTNAAVVMIAERAADLIRSS